MVRAFVFGIVQGITEFIPVSSSGHLNLLNWIFDLELSVAFFVWLHAATLLSLLFFFFKDLKDILRNKPVFLKVVSAAGITAIGALAVKYTGLDEVIFARRAVTSFSFLVTAILLFSVRKSKGVRTIDSITIKDIVIIGVLQVFALAPGISRAGITIVTMLKRGMAPLEAFKFSFFMAIPLIFGAFLIEVKYIFNSGLSGGFIITGFISAFLSGIIALFILSVFLARRKMHLFSYYVFILFIGSIFLWQV